MTVADYPDCPCHQTYLADCHIAEHRRQVGEYTPWAYLTPRERRQQFRVIEGQLGEPLPFDRVEHLRRIGKLGGQRNAERHGADHMGELGKKGGAIVRQARGHDYYVEIGRKGGNALKASRGVDHFAEMGKKGRESRAARRTSRADQATEKSDG